MAIVGVTPDGNADSLLRREDDDWIDEPVVLMDDIDTDLDEQRELAVDDTHGKGLYPPILQSILGASLMDLRTLVVLRSIVEGVDGIGVEAWPSDENTLL